MFTLPLTEVAHFVGKLISLVKFSPSLIPDSCQAKRNDNCNDKQNKHKKLGVVRSGTDSVNSQSKRIELDRLNWFIGCPVFGKQLNKTECKAGTTAKG